MRVTVEDLQQAQAVLNEKAEEGDALSRVSEWMSEVMERMRKNPR